ncbi:MAG: zinc-dependent metalloprotease [Pseudomonadota bacterium]
MRLLTAILLYFALTAFSFTPFALAQDAEDEEEEDETVYLAEYVEDFELTDGLFPLYQDPETGSLYMGVGVDQLDEEFIYFLYTENGPVEAGHFRGQFRDNRVIAFRQHFDRVEIEAINTNFYFDEGSALSRSADANIARAPIANVPVVAESEDGDTLLISADKFLKSEALHQVTPWRSPDTPPGAVFSLGSLSSDKTRVTEFSNFPENTDIRVEYVYDNPSPMNYGRADITDARSVAIKVQHSFLEMPEPGFEPRADDFRVGYFTDQSTDLTSHSYTPFKDAINRWRLVKKDPAAAMSDPVEPIVFWIENTTPENLRDTIREAGLAWNVAFEAAGISNAIEIKVQPDDAEWDAGDIRYNVMRWTSSPNPPFGGYGPSFTNPRTGEILGADIMLEYIFLTNRMRYAEIYDTAGLPSFSEATPAHSHGPHCDFASHLQTEMMTARAVLTAQRAGREEQEELVRQELFYLVIHEIGHTLGLTHNMRSSHSVTLADLQSTDVNPVNSVMDYPAVNLAGEGENQGLYALMTPAAYDIWAIQYGYAPEDADLDAILARSTEPQLVYGNDADDMRAPGRHVDPRVMINDLSDDPIGWADGRVDLIEATLALLPERMLEEGGAYQPLYNSYMALTGQRAGAANVASRWIGGVYNNRAAVGQPGADRPLVPVPVEEQRRALALLNRTAFAPDAFSAGEEMLDLLQVQRRGFNVYGINADPKPHARALRVQRRLLDHLLHPNVLARLTDSRRYGGEYPVGTYMLELTDVMFAADARTAVNTYRQNLQIEYVHRLIRVASGQGGGAVATPSGRQGLPNYDYISRTAALASLEEVKDVVRRRTSDSETRAHREHIKELIEVFERR